MKEMTSLERVQAVLEGRIPDRIPVIPQGFMFSANAAGYNIGQINRSPKLMAESHRICQEKYGYDGCVIDVDDASLAEACGAKVIFREDSVATVDEHNPVLEDLRDIDDLHMPDPGPFNLLCLLRGTQDFMMDLLTEEEDVIFHALEWATEAHSRFARAQLKIAHATSMGDAYASPELVSPEMYRRFALPAEKKVVENVADLNKPYSIHICGNTTGIIEDMSNAGSKILEVDWKLDMASAREIVRDDIVLMGNLNPSDPMCIGTPDKVREQAEAIIRGTKGKGLILSSGCALGANTKPENMEALVVSAKEFGSYEQIAALQGK